VHRSILVVLALAAAPAHAVDSGELARVKADGNACKPAP
jgi:hypothetical protein